MSILDMFLVQFSFIPCQNSAIPYPFLCVHEENLSVKGVCALVLLRITYLAASSPACAHSCKHSVVIQVHALRRSQRQGSRRHEETPPPEAQDILKPARRRGREKKSSSSNEELRMTLEAAAMAAKAAADAAEAAATSVARNTEAIEFVVNSMQSSKKRRESKSAAASDEKKAIVKSNQTTHWILGLMAISSIAWRFGVVKVAKRISSKLNDPIGYVGGLIGNNDSPTKEDLEKPSEKGNFLDKLPHIDFPEFLPNDADHKTNDKETNAKETKETKAKVTSMFSKSAAAVDVKAKEVEKTAFSFVNLLQTKSNKT